MDTCSGVQPGSVNAAFRPRLPRQEPYAVVPHVRICAGGAQQWASLPRYLDRHRSILDGNGMTAAIESIANAHELAAHSGHCIAVALDLLDLSPEAPRSEHAAAVPRLFWTQFAKARAV